MSYFNFGCKEDTTLSNEKIRSQNIEDSLTKTLTSKILNRDRIKDSIVQSEQKKVISNIEFGMSELESKKLIKEFVKSSEKKYDEESTFNDHFIGDYEFSSYGVFGVYENDSLFFLKVGGKNIHYDYYERDLNHQLGFIKDVIYSKYGEPTLNNGLPERYKINEESSFTAYSWTVGTKNIDITIDEDGLYYSVDLYIYQPEILNMRTERRKAKNKEKAESLGDTF